MFLALEKLCSMQMVSQTCTGENRRQKKQTNKQANQKSFSLSIRRDMIPFLIKALTLAFSEGFVCNDEEICKETCLLKLQNK